MMKIKLKTYLFSFCFSVLAFVNAQDKKSIITYQSSLNITYRDSFIKDLEKQKLPMHIKQGVFDIYMSARPIDIILNIKNNESYCYPIKVLDDTFGYNMASGVCINDYYTNATSHKTIEMSDNLGYILCDPLEWEITNTKKTIATYTCYKATASERLFSRKGDIYYKTITAWFTPKIPLNFGPKNYNGLPGLILEVEWDMFTITATKINLNPNEKVTIKKPNPKTKVQTFEQVNNYIIEAEKSRKAEKYGN